MGKCSMEEKAESIEILDFGLNNDNSLETYSIETSYVDEVYSVKNVTILPCTPSFIVGIINFRGKIISVIDIRNFLGFSMEKKDTYDVKKVIVIKIDDIEFGIVADSIIGCDKIPISEIQNNILGITNFKTNYIKGITKKRSIILDIKNIITDEKITVEEEVIL